MGFDDDFFGGGFGGGGFGGQSMFSQMQMGGGGGGFTRMQTFQASSGVMPGSSSMSTQTYIENGKRVTRTEKTTVDRSGNQVTEITEETDDGRGNITQNQYMLEGNGAQ